MTIERQLVPLTKDLAVKWADMPRSPVERRVQESRIKKLFHSFTNGDMGVLVWASARYKNGVGIVEHRVNGQHTSLMFSGRSSFGDVQIPDGAQVLIETHNVNNLSDVRRVWGIYDSDVSQNKTSEILFSEKDFIPQVKDIPDRLFRKIVSGIRLSKRPETQLRGGANTWDQTRWANLVSDNVNAIRCCSEVLHDAPRWMLRAPVIAAVANTLEANHGDAFRFWTLVKNESAMNSGDVTRALARYLVVTTIRGGAQRQTSGDYNDAETMYRKCIAAWNHWRKGKPLKRLCAAKSRPKVSR
ncbi:MAG TPA: hypothetical protein VMY37_05360 [Thermoguttaceae bacterium]|nr:hypothetical protein [Thermoguttaceae bacterium]